MKAIKNNLDNTSDLARITNALRSILANKECDVEVIIQERDESRRGLQNNLWYHWIGEFKAYKKWTEKHVRGYLKYNYALPVMRRNPKYNLTVQMFDGVADNMGSNKDLHLAVVTPMTSLLTVKEMHEVLSETQTQSSIVDGVYLTDSFDLMHK